MVGLCGLRMAAGGSVSITMKQSSKKRSSVFFAADSVQTTVKSSAVVAAKTCKRDARALAHFQKPLWGHAVGLVPRFIAFSPLGSLDKATAVVADASVAYLNSNRTS